MDFVLRLSDVEHVGMLLRSGANPNVPWSQLATAIDKSYESEVGSSNYQKVLALLPQAITAWCQ